MTIRSNSSDLWTTALLLTVLVAIAACQTSSDTPTSATQAIGPTPSTAESIATTVGPAEPTTTTVGGAESVTAARKVTTYEGEINYGWPTAAWNPAGVYSWDGRRCNAGWCNRSWMHNGYGSGDVEIRIKVVPQGAIADDHATAVTVAGHDGTYRRLGTAGSEKWVVDIEGITIAIILEARSGTSQADLAEAHAIIDSMHAEPINNNLGFRLVFTLTTDNWDSG